MSLKSFTTGSGPMTKVRAEQIKAEIVTGGTLASDLLGIKEQVAAIAGAAFDVDYAADYANVQMADLAKHVDASAAAGGALRVIGSLTGALGVTAASFTADGLASVGSAKVANLNAVEGGLVFADADGDLDNDANLKFASSKLSVVGAISGSGALEVGGEATLASAIVSDLTEKRVVFAGAGGALVDDANLVFDISGATDVLKVVGEISGSAALKSGGTLDVAGNSALAGTLTVTSTSQFNDNVTIANGKTLTVGGDLIVNGTTTTVNSTTLQVDDVNIELGHSPSGVAGSDATAEGGGITLKGTTDKTIIWQAAKGWTFSEKIEAPSALFIAGASAAHLTASNLDNQQLAFAASDAGEIVGSGNLLWTGAQLKVTGQVSGSGDFLGGANATFMGQVGAGSARIAGLADLRGGSNLSGSVFVPARAANKIVLTDNNKALFDGDLSWSVPAVGGFELQVGAGPNALRIKSGSLDTSGPLDVKAGGDLILSGGNLVKFQGYGSVNTVALSDDKAEFDGFFSDFGGDSILGALRSLKSAAAAAAAKNVVKAGGAQAAGANLVTALPIAIPTGYTAANSMVFVNGQMLMSGTQAAVAATPATADYSFDGGEFKLSFALEEGDVVTIQKV